ncbi:MAG: Fe-Mn family superoxide dismutase [Patescibacteria group bacterium]
MKKFKEAEFNIPALKGISAKNIEEHLKLYAGYVKNANLILEHIEEFSQNSEKYAYELGELQRRFGFEFNGMVNHEYYFESLSDEPKVLTEASELRKTITEEWGSCETWLNRFKAIALTRGIGWAILYYDPLTKRLLNAWIEEQHLGQLNGCKTILAIDMWEHAFIYDYPTSEKKKYVETFFDNLNWTVIEKNFTEAKI